MKLEGAKVLVTGADGFIGSHLVERLMECGCQVRAFTFYNSFNSWGWLDTLAPDKRRGLEVFCGDIRDPNGVREAVKGAAVVFHLAALIAIPFSYHSPDSYVDTNVKGTLNVLQAARETGVQRVLVTSTSEVYGTARYVPIDEGHPYQAQSPYSATKIAADRLAESFRRSFDLPVVIVRPFNTYGPRQSARAIIPTVISQVAQGKDRILLGNLKPTRDLVFVSDTVRGFTELASCDEAAGKEINIATGREVSVGDLARMIISRMGSKTRVELDTERVRPDASEVDRLLGSAALLRRLTGWSPSVSLEEGLENTIRWFTLDENLRRYKADIYNL